MIVFYCKLLFLTYGFFFSQFLLFVLLSLVSEDIIFSCTSSWVSAFLFKLKRKCGVQSTFLLLTDCACFNSTRFSTCSGGSRHCEPKRRDVDYTLGTQPAPLLTKGKYEDWRFKFEKWGRGVSNFAILILHALLFILVISQHWLDIEAAMLFKNLGTFV